MVNAAVVYHPMERQSWKNRVVCPHLPNSLDLALQNFWLFPKIKMTINTNHGELTQGIKAATRAQLRTFIKQDF